MKTIVIRRVATVVEYEWAGGPEHGVICSVHGTYELAERALKAASHPTHLGLRQVSGTARRGERAS